MEKDSHIQFQKAVSNLKYKADYQFIQSALDLLTETPSEKIRALNYAIDQFWEDIIRAGGGKLEEYEHNYLSILHEHLAEIISGKSN